VDAGGGEIALHNAVYKRFLRMDGERVDGFGGIMNVEKLPSGWANERFTLVDAGKGKFAFHNSKHNRFIRMTGESVDAKGGVRDVR